jgi:hypothetical protein
VGILLLEAFGCRHNNRQKIGHTRKSTGSIRLSRLFNNSVNLRRDGGVVREISSAFLGLWVGFPLWATPNLLLGGFGHQHNNRQKIEHARKSTGEIRQTGLSKNIVNWR